MGIIGKATDERRRYTARMSAAISVENLHKHYGAIHALRGVNLEIPPGRCFGLLGPNGAGKSTLISLVAGLIRPTTGHARVMGHDVQADYRAARRALGLVPQELVIDPFFAIRDLLRNQAGYFGLGREQWPWIDHVMQELDLTNKANSYMRALSGGMKRRVLIAMALVHKPPVIILDEPTAGVDVELRRTLWRFVRRLHAEGHSIILTTHYLEEAEELCDEIAILNKGQLQVRESTPALLARHPYRFLRVQLEAGAALPETIRPLLVSEKSGEFELRLHRDHDRIGDVLDAIRNGGNRLLDVRTRDPSLEDVFREVTA